MLLCIDIGNTNIKIGLFDGETMEQFWRFSTARAKLADEYAMLILDLFSSVGLKSDVVTGCALSSVVPALTQEFQELIKRYFSTDVVMFDPKMDIGLSINTDYPAEVGHDLIMNALAAREIYGFPVIVVGFGTATSFVAVSAAGDLEGVAIAPGVVSSSDSLFKSASALPQVALTHPKTSIGKNTLDSMRAGIVFGFAGMVEKVVQRMKAELGGLPKVVATGGLAKLIGPETSVIDEIVPNLALLGLKNMYYQNQKRIN